MKYFKILHTVLGIIPFAWLCSLLLILFIGICHFGYVPQSGNPVDPYSLGLDWIYSFEVWLGLFGFLSFFLWPLVTVMLHIFYRNMIVFNKLSVILFLVGTIGFFVFRYGFTAIFLWVAD